MSRRPGASRGRGFVPRRSGLCDGPLRGRGGKTPCRRNPAWVRASSCGGARNDGRSGRATTHRRSTSREWATCPAPGSTVERVRARRFRSHPVCRMRLSVLPQEASGQEIGADALTSFSTAMRGSVSTTGRRCGLRRAAHGARPGRSRCRRRAGCCSWRLAGEPPHDAAPNKRKGRPARRPSRSWSPSDQRVAGTIASDGGALICGAGESVGTA